jgi:peptidyl-dipeptidase A
VTAEAVVASCGATLQPLETAANAAWWDANTDASDETQRRRADADIALSDALADADAFADVRAAQAESGIDPLVARQLEVLVQGFTPQQVDADLRREIVEVQSDIESRFARHRGEIDGTDVDDNEILEVLRTSNDNAHRRAAWEASKSVGAEVAPAVRELARLRNRAARSVGYRDHFALALAMTDFDEARLFTTLAEVDELTAAPFRTLKAELDEQVSTRFGLDVGALRPWHYDDPFFQDAPSAVGVDLDPYLAAADVDALTVQTFDSMGLDVRGVLARSDLTPRPGKSQHAFCIDVDRVGDVRVLSNNTPSERWAETMLHEFGHAVYFEGVSRDLPWLLRTMHICVTEAVAMRCGRLVRDPEWLAAIAGLPAAEVAVLAPRTRAASRAYLLIFARWVLVMTHFEHGLYADPDADHNTRWWDLVERFQLVHRPDDRHAPDWAAKIHIAAAPVYYHNYLFGEMIASQLSAALGGLVDNTEAGRALATRMFAPGATLRWDRLVEHATGSPLDPALFARDLANSY